MRKHDSRSTRATKDKLDPKAKQIAKESTELNQDDLDQVTGGAVVQAGWNLAQNKKTA